MPLQCLTVSVTSSPCAFFSAGIVDKRKARTSDLPSFSELRRCEMHNKLYLVCLSALSALWLNGELHVNIDMSLSISATALVLYALLKR